MSQRRLLKARNRKKVVPVKRGRPKGSKNPESTISSHRNLEIKRLFCEQENTLESIGAKFDITRERVRQILLKMGIKNSDSKLKKDITGRKLAIPHCAKKIGN